MPEFLLGKGVTRPSGILKPEMYMGIQVVFVSFNDILRCPRHFCCGIVWEELAAFHGVSSCARIGGQVKLCKVIQLL